MQSNSMHLDYASNMQFIFDFMTFSWQSFFSFIDYQWVTDSCL